MEQEAHRGRNIFGSEPPFDATDGRNTHIANIAIGNFVTGDNFNGLASVNSSRVALMAHVSIYEVFEKNCPDEPLAMVGDGVDVISLSISGSFDPMYDHDPSHRARSPLIS